MTDRELRKLNRRELLGMLIASQEENEQLRDRISKLTAQLEQRELAENECGSMAEAALKLNGVFEAVDKAAAQYLESIRRYAEREKSIAYGAIPTWED